MGIHEPLQSFSWEIFVFTTVLYTLVPFLAGAKYGNTQHISQIIAKLKSHPTSTIGIHLGFLTILLTLISMTIHFYASLPDWAKGRGSKLSVLDIAVLFMAILMQFVEQRWILSKSK
jgi:hypothetical protein